MTDQIIAARRDRGAALLDEKRHGWWEFTSVDGLDMASFDDCVVGQEYRTKQHPFEDGANHLFDDEPGFDYWHPLLVDHGFSAPRDICGTAEGERYYDALTAAWRELIAARREAEARS